jgi:DNA-binding PadR family transcriptional regulator
MAKSKRSNPLALAVLACLQERPMHPYEMATTMRQRGKHESIKLNYGSLYTVVQSLERARMIEAQETEREGRRPERTVYALLDAGRIELIDWLSEMLSTPAKEFTQFEAALSLLPCLPPEDVLALLEDRIQASELSLVAERSVRDHAAQQGLPRLFAVETEYRIVMREAELAFTKRLAEDIRSDSFEGLAFWNEYHRSAAPPPKQLPQAANERNADDGHNP